jgi:hypothetical protein
MFDGRLRAIDWDLYLVRAVGEDSKEGCAHLGHQEPMLKKRFPDPDVSGQL